MLKWLMYNYWVKVNWNNCLKKVEKIHLSWFKNITYACGKKKVYEKNVKQNS